MPVCRIPERRVQFAENQNAELYTKYYVKCFGLFKCYPYTDAGYCSFYSKCDRGVIWVVVQSIYRCYC